MCYLLIHHFSYILACSPYGYGYGNRHCGATGFLTIFLIVFIVSAILVIVLSLNFASTPGDVDITKEYALTDKVIHSYNTEFCQGLLAKSTNTPNSPQSNATLYLLSKPPSLSDVESFNITKTAGFMSEGDHHNWNFHLNEGSKVTLNACYQENTMNKYGVKFYLIRGNRNFSDWIDDPHDLNNYVLQRSLLHTCTTISYDVVDGGKYYFAFYGYSYTYVLLSVDFQFHRTVYHVSPDSIFEKCTIPLDGQASCSVNVPLSSNYAALLSFNTSLPVDYSDGADVYISCQPRIWLYAVIVLCAVVPTVIIITLVVVCICVKVRRGRRKYLPLVENTVPTATDAFEDSRNVNVTTGVRVADANPQPYNPACPPASDGYGATSTTVSPHANLQ